MAADRALGLDVVRAEALLAKALALTAPDDPEHLDIALAWADAANQNARYQDAARAIDSLMPTLRAAQDPERLAAALVRRSEIAYSTGDASPLGIAKEAVALLDDRPGPLLLEALARLARFQWLAGQPTEAISTLDHATEVADELGLPLPSRAAGLRGLARAELGDIVGIAEAEGALEALVAAGGGWDVGRLMTNIALFRWMIEGTGAALAGMDEARAFARQRNIVTQVDLNDENRVDILVEAGMIEEALATCRRNEARADAIGDSFTFADSAAWTGYLLVERGQVELGVEHCEHALASLEGTESIDLITGLARIAAVSQVTDDTVRARALLERIIAAPGVKTSLFYGIWLPTMVRTALALGDRALAERVTAGFEPRYPVHDAANVAARARLKEHDGDPSAAADLYRDSAHRYDELGHRKERAFSLMGRGRCLAALGEPQAGESLASARATFVEFGFTRTADEISRLLETVSARAG